MTKPPVSSGPERRRPASFSLDDERAPAPDVASAEPVRRMPRNFEDGVTITPDHEDPFLSDPPSTVPENLPVAKPRRRKFSFLGMAMSGIGILLSLAFGLWTDQLIRDLFTRADWLGYTAIAALSLALLGVAVVVARELVGIFRLNAVQSLKAEAEKAEADHRPKAARAVVARLVALFADRAETSKGRATLKATEDDIIDGVHLIALAERELLAPLDRQARALILNSSKRVSVVTAVSPRAVVDLAYVLFEVTRLVRAMAELYGGRPGTLGMIRLLRDVLAHLAVTGSIAIGDGLAQQVLGHGLASKLSARLGEGVINGLMTARIGIAAMDLCRPLPFKALKRPGISDFVGDLTPSLTGRDTTRNS